MEIFSTPRVLLSGSGAQAGKSFIGLGLAVALRKRGLSLSCCVVGSNLHQASMYRRISGRFVRTLDGRLLTKGQLLTSAYQAGIGADIILIEGQGGLYDGWSPASLRGSDAEIAQASFTPVTLIVDVTHLGCSLAALLKGYSNFAEGVNIVGSIANQVSTRPEGDEGSGSIYYEEDGLDPHEREFMDETLASYNLKPLLGFIPHTPLEGNLPPSRLQQKKNVSLLPRQFLIDIATLIERYVDIDALIAESQNGVSVRLGDYKHSPSGRRARIAVTDDSCFHLCFQDNLDLLRYYGAEVSFFSPLADVQLPSRTGAVYVTGGFLQEYGRDLARNESMRQALFDFSRRGGVIYSEGAGTAYLCEEIWLTPSGDERIPGVGILPGIAKPAPHRFNYEEVIFRDECILGPAQTHVKGVSTSEWVIETDRRVVKAFDIRRSGSRIEQEGFSPGAQIVGTLSLLHWGSNSELARALVDAAVVVYKL